MTAKRIIPITPIMRRYQALRKLPQQQRAAEAVRLVGHPAELADEFVASVAHFTPYNNADEPFYPPERATREFAEDVKRTNDIVLRLDDQQHLVPIDAPGRHNDHDAGPLVHSVPAAQLAMDYLDRELLVQRTTSPAAWEDGTPNRGGVRLDVLLADAADRTPIVGELKLPGDMDPFFALVQALACAAHLATPNQYERLRRHSHRVKLPERSKPPRLDIGVLFLSPPDHDPAQPPRGRYMAELTTAAETLAPKLLAHEALAATVRRIAGLDLHLDDTGAVAAKVRWAWQRAA
ncbi:MAG: hypothetical protein ACRDL8_04020 [Solirubrobacteraceae bacterium]